MGEITIKRWQCDRCGSLFDERQPNKSGIVTLMYGRNGDVGPYAKFAWKEVCNPCSKLIAKTVESLKP